MSNATAFWKPAMTGDGMYRMSPPSRSAPNSAWKMPDATTTKKTRVSVRWISPWAATAAGPRTTPSSTTAAMMSVTTLRGVYMSPAEPPGMAPARSAMMALTSPAMTPYET